MLFSSNYLLWVMIPSLILSLGAQMWVRSAYTKWSNTRNTLGLSGTEVAERIKRTAGLGNVGLEGTPGKLSDHFDPRGNVVRMSQDIASKPSVASMAIVAHELGHAQQYKEQSPLISMRSFLVPAMQISPNIAYALIFAGIFFNLTGLLWVGIAFFGVTVVFMLLTLPVEFDASRRGLLLLREAGLTSSAEDASGARQMLTAAAMTYVAAFVSSLLTLLYYLSIARRNN
ncbi:MAG: zinc metallopeptidase [Chitinophagaceae bacterium]|nr:zinc metallopeptidase [Anaerolineae bacterium]